MIGSRQLDRVLHAIREAGAKAVLVGDPEQLPPTNIGQRGEAEDDDGATIQSQQSILDECVACNLPRIRLNWHYRSKHESLIAFSNARYYRSELVNCPPKVRQRELSDGAC